MIVVSSCLAGLEVRYNGTHRLDSRIQELVRSLEEMAKMSFRVMHKSSIG